MTIGLFGMNRKPATAKLVVEGTETKACTPSQTGTRKPATAHKPAVHRDYHIPGLPMTIAEAKELGWTFELVGEAEGKRAIDIVTVKGIAPNATASKMFHERLVDTPFYKARTIAEALALGWTFELIGDAKGKGHLAPVEVEFTSPLGMVSKTFTMLFGATPFYTGPAITTSVAPKRKPGKTLAEQAQHKAEVAARNRALCMSTRTGSGGSSTSSSGKKGKGKAKR